jgi:hypothetical protein
MDKSSHSNETNMKKTTLYKRFLLILLLSSSVQADQKTLYNSKSYPYNSLLSRTKSIKIIYIENMNDINCKVEVNWQNEIVTTAKSRVSKSILIKSLWLVAYQEQKLKRS